MKSPKHRSVETMPEKPSFSCRVTGSAKFEYLIIGLIVGGLVGATTLGPPLPGAAGYDWQAIVGLALFFGAFSGVIGATSDWYFGRDTETEGETNEPTKPK